MSETETGKQLAPFEPKMGPAMASLASEKQRAFVDALFDVPPGRGAMVAAARVAGYQGDPHSMTATANRLMRDPKIQAAITEETKRKMRGLGPAAVSAIAGILGNTLHRDQLKAALAVINKVDPDITRVQGEIHHTHEVIDHDKEAVAQLRTLQSLGVAEIKLIELFGINGLERYRRMLAAEDAAKAATAQPIIEAEFTEITTQPVAERDPDAELLGE